MPQDVIDRVHTLARRAAANIALTFGDRYGQIIPDEEDDDDDDDEDYTPPDEESHDGDDANSYNTDDDYPFDEADDQPDPDPADAAGVMGYFPENNGTNKVAEPGNADNVDANEQNDNDNEADEPGNIDGNDNDVENIDGNDNNVENENNNPVDTPAVEPDPNASSESDDETYEPPEEGSESGESNETEDHDTDRVMEQLYGPRSSAHGLRPRKPRNYEHLHTTAGEPSRNASGLLNEPYGIDPASVRQHQWITITCSPPWPILRRRR
jgi:hypothetical protein